MNLTTDQKKIYEKIYSVDSEWNQESFAKVWNDILQLNKFVSIGNGRLVLEFFDPNYIMVKLKKNDKIVLDEKIYWNDLIALDDDKENEVKRIAHLIKDLANRIITN